MNETQLHQPDYKFDYDPMDPVAVQTVAKATAEMIRPGIYTNIPEDIYHAMPLPSAHKLWTFRKTSPYHFWDKYLNPNREVEKYESTALTIGKAFHLSVLEPTKAGLVRMAPELNLRTKDGKAQMDEFKKSCEPGSLILQPNDFQRLFQMIGEFWKSEKNQTHFKNTNEGLNEVTIIWIEQGIKMRGRIDRVVGNQLHDLKTANDVSRYAFGDAANRYGYAWQLMIYQRGWFQLTGEVLNPLITAIESDRPYQTKMFTVSDAQFEREAEIFEKIIAIYKYCVTNNHWVSYAEEPELLFTRMNYFDERQWFDDILQKTTFIETQKGVGHVKHS